MACYSTLDNPPDYKDYFGKPLNIKLQTQMNEIRKTKNKPIQEVSNLELQDPHPAAAPTHDDHEHNINIAPGACFASPHEASVLELALSEFDDPIPTQHMPTRPTDAKVECIHVLYHHHHDYMIANHDPGAVSNLDALLETALEEFDDHDYMIANRDHMIANCHFADA